MLGDILSQLRKEGWNIHEEKGKITIGKTEKEKREITIETSFDVSQNKIYRCSYFISQNLQDLEYPRSEKELIEYICKIK